MSTMDIRNLYPFQSSVGKPSLRSGTQQENELLRPPYTTRVSEVLPEMSEYTWIRECKKRFIVPSTISLRESRNSAEYYLDCCNVETDFEMLKELIDSYGLLLTSEKNWQNKIISRFEILDYAVRDFLSYLAVAGQKKYLLAVDELSNTLFNYKQALESQAISDCSVNMFRRGSFSSTEVTVQPKSGFIFTDSEQTQIRSSLRGSSAILSDELNVLLSNSQADVNEHQNEMDLDVDVSVTPFLDDVELGNGLKSAPGNNSSMAFEIAVDKLVETTNSNDVFINAGYKVTTFKATSKEPCNSNYTHPCESCADTDSELVSSDYEDDGFLEDTDSEPLEFDEVFAEADDVPGVLIDHLILECQPEGDLQPDLDVPLTPFLDDLEVGKRLKSVPGNILSVALKIAVDKLVETTNYYSEFGSFDYEDNVFLEDTDSEPSEFEKVDVEADAVILGVNPEYQEVEYPCMNTSQVVFDVPGVLIDYLTLEPQPDAELEPELMDNTILMDQLILEPCPDVELRPELLSKQVLMHQSVLEPQPDVLPDVVHAEIYDQETVLEPLGYDVSCSESYAISGPLEEHLISGSSSLEKPGVMHLENVADHHNHSTLTPYCGSSPAMYQDGSRSPLRKDNFGLLVGLHIFSFTLILIGMCVLGINEIFGTLLVLFLYLMPDQVFIDPETGNRSAIQGGSLPVVFPFSSIILSMFELKDVGASIRAENLVGFSADLDPTLEKILIFSLTLFYLYSMFPLIPITLLVFGMGDNGTFQETEGLLVSLLDLYPTKKIVLIFYPNPSLKKILISSLVFIDLWLMFPLIPITLLVFGMGDIEAVIRAEDPVSLFADSDPTLRKKSKSKSSFPFLSILLPLTLIILLVFGVGDNKAKNRGNHSFWYRAHTLWEEVISYCWAEYLVNFFTDLDLTLREKTQPESIFLCLLIMLSLPPIILWMFGVGENETIDRGNQEFWFSEDSPWKEFIHYVWADYLVNLSTDLDPTLRKKQGPGSSFGYFLLVFPLISIILLMFGMGDNEAHSRDDHKFWFREEPPWGGDLVFKLNSSSSFKISQNTEVIIIDDLLAAIGKYCGFLLAIICLCGLKNQLFGIYIVICRNTTFNRVNNFAQTSYHVQTLLIPMTIIPPVSAIANKLAKELDETIKYEHTWMQAMREELQGQMTIIPKLIATRSILLTGNRPFWKEYDKALVISKPLVMCRFVNSDEPLVKLAKLVNKMESREEKVEHLVDVSEVLVLPPLLSPHYTYECMDAGRRVKGRAKRHQVMCGPLPPLLDPGPAVEAHAPYEWREH